ncbi:MAG: hypothetical protein ACYTEQ_25830 [Planctomycetota bacterium]|jgi:hypothetical protein
MTSELSTFFQTKTGARLMSAFEDIALELKRLRHAIETPEVETALAPPVPVVAIPEPANVLARWREEQNDYFVEQYQEGPWPFKHARAEYAETVFFHRGEMGWHFWGTIGGKSRDEIEFMSITGDAGNDSFVSHKMSFEGFAHWIGHSHSHYLFSKSDTRREFDWTRARADFEAYAVEKEKELRDEDGEDSDSVRRFASLVEDINEGLHNNDYNSQQSFAEAIYRAIPGDDEFDLNACLSECDWGMVYSPQAYARWRQARYFALWLLEREALRAKQSTTLEQERDQDGTTGEG